MEAGRATIERNRQRRPHAIRGLSRMARWWSLTFDFKGLACGLHPINALPNLITDDYELTDIKRAHGHVPETPAVTGGASVPVSRSTSSDSGGQVMLQERPAAPPRCNALSRWSRIMRRMKS